MRSEINKAILMVFLMLISTTAGCMGGDETADETDDNNGGTDNNTNGTDNNTNGTDNNTGGNTTSDVDSDNDGILDDDDNCPGTPDGDDVDSSGCTIVIDADGDGVTDADDQCANTPAGTAVDAMGCSVPEAIQVSIGLLSPITGDLSDLSAGIENAAQLAIDSMNEDQHKYEFSLIVEDSGCVATTATSAAQNLADAGVSGIAGPACDAATMSAMQVAKDESIPMISYASTSPEVSTADDNDYLWRVVASTAYEGVAASTWSQLAQISNVAILAKNTNAEAPIAEAFITAAEDAGIEICYTAYYDAETTDFSSDVTAIDDAGCDGVMLVSEMSDGRAIIEELGNQEMLGEDGITVVGHGGIGNSDFTSNFSNPGLLDGIYGSRFSAPENTLEVNIFRNEYTTAFSTEPGDLAAEAYDATTLLMLAVEEANSTLGADVNNALMAVGTDHAGATGDFSFEDNGDVPGAMYEFWKFTCEDCDDDGVGEIITFEIVATWGPYEGIWANCRSGTPIVEIGLLYPATGANSDGSDGFRNGAELAAMLVNVQQRDICFEVVSEDTQSTAAGAATAAELLIDANVVGLVGPGDCQETLAAAEVAIEEETTIISYACSSPELTTYDDGQDRPGGNGFLWRTTHSDAWPAESAADYVIGMGLDADTGAAIYRTDDALGDNLSAAFSDRMGGTVCGDVSFTPGTIGATHTVVDCEAVVIFADAIDSARIVDDLNDKGFTGQIIGNGAMDSPEFDSAVTTSTDDMVIVAYAESSFSSSLSAAFEVAYDMNYGTSPPAYSAEAADGALMIALSFIFGYNVGLSGTSNSKYVNWFIPAVADEYAGASGILTVDSDTGDMPSKGYFNIFRMVAGTLELEYTWDPMNTLEAAED